MDAIGIFLVLVGPPGVGKTPISELLAKELQVEHLMLDLMEYRRECIGWNQERELEIWRKFGTEARYDYRSRFTVPMLRSLVEEFPAAVIDCGGDEFLTSTREARIELRRELENLDGVRIAAILPSPDVKETREFLRSSPEIRKTAENEFMYNNPSYLEVADKAFFRKDKTLEVVAREILEWLVS